MAVSLVERQLTYQERLDALRAKKMEFTAEKQKAIGYMDFDDHAIILPPPEYRPAAHRQMGVRASGGSPDPSSRV